jgi:flavin reductase (DIM6/NTAB) family NADH-FMN oxidoreductase RutF
MTALLLRIGSWIMDHDDGEASGSTACNANDTSPKWIHLLDKKDFSRLLYPNPVCFLSTLSTKDGSSDASKRRANVMVLSWLTATNNSGRFMFSINRSRHSATNVVPIDESSGKARTGVDFVLSIPVQGMEQLVLDVGGTSGKWGSKFVADHNQNDAEPADVDLTSMSNRQKKKLKRMRLAKGIPNLEAVPIGHSDAYASAREKNLLFAINGTCSHIHCRTCAILEEPASSATGIVDEEHFLVIAEVIDAHVHSSYWDATKKQFRPMRDDVPPYLTFFGAQTFGYIRNR